jgi:pyridoxine kinase
MGDDGKLYVSEALVDAFKSKLVPIADLIAPNAFELGVLADVAARDLNSARAAAARLGKTALVSSIPHGQDIAAALLSDEKRLAFTTPRLPSPARGAGDLFAALFLARVLNDEGDALCKAMASVFDVIAAGGEDLKLPEMQDALCNPQTQPLEIGETF